MEKAVIFHGFETNKDTGDFVKRVVAWHKAKEDGTSLRAEAYDWSPGVWWESGIEGEAVSVTRFRVRNFTEEEIAELEALGGTRFQFTGAHRTGRGSRVGGERVFTSPMREFTDTISIELPDGEDLDTDLDTDLCSFCSTPRPINRLIRGEGSQICFECVGRYGALLGEPPPDGGETP